MRIYAAICAYIEARANNINAHTTQVNVPEETEQPQPNGNCFSDTQVSHQSDFNHEMNGNDRPGHYGRHISLKWWPKDEPTQS